MNVEMFCWGREVTILGTASFHVTFDAVFAFESSQHMNITLCDTWGTLCLRDCQTGQCVSGSWRS